LPLDQFAFDLDPAGGRMKSARIVKKQFHGSASHLVKRQHQRGQGRVHILCDLAIIKADDGNVVRHCQPEFA
jgi:hypothetical protein